MISPKPKLYHLAEVAGAQIEAEHRANVLYNSLKLSVSLLKKAGVENEELNKILKEYK